MFDTIHHFHDICQFIIPFVLPLHDELHNKKFTTIFPSHPKALQSNHSKTNFKFP